VLYAAVIGISAVVGMAAGAGLWRVATAAHFLVLYRYSAMLTLFPGSRWAPSALSLPYREGQGVLRRALAECTARGAYRCR